MVMEIMEQIQCKADEPVWENITLEELVLFHNSSNGYENRKDIFITIVAKALNKIRPTMVTANELSFFLDELEPYEDSISIEAIREVAKKYLLIKA